jgi:hypothetical protein
MSSVPAQSRERGGQVKSALSAGHLEDDIERLGYLSRVRGVARGGGAVRQCGPLGVRSHIDRDELADGTGREELEQAQPHEAGSDDGDAIAGAEPGAAHRLDDAAEWLADAGFVAESGRRRRRTRPVRRSVR